MSWGRLALPSTGQRRTPPPCVGQSAAAALCPPRGAHWAFLSVIVGGKAGGPLVLQLVRYALHPTEVGKLVEKQHTCRIARERLSRRERVHDGECSSGGHGEAPFSRQRHGQAFAAMLGRVARSAHIARSVRSIRGTGAVVPSRHVAGDEPGGKCPCPCPLPPGAHRVREVPSLCGCFGSLPGRCGLQRLRRRHVTTGPGSVGVRHRRAGGVLES